MARIASYDKFMKKKNSTSGPSKTFITESILRRNLKYGCLTNLNTVVIIIKSIAVMFFTTPAATQHVHCQCFERIAKMIKKNI